tara:strand:+ start:572 stop:742 length:171 start_codon:yes stop_codon:yes gene_type:complete
MTHEVFEVAALLIAVAFCINAISSMSIALRVPHRPASAFAVFPVILHCVLGLEIFM